MYAVLDRPVLRRVPVLRLTPLVAILDAAERRYIDPLKISQHAP